MSLLGLEVIRDNRRLLWSLTKNDIKARYSGSLLGIVWMYALPMINIFIIWFAFSQGLKIAPDGGVPFVLWLLTGMIPWNFFSDAVQGASHSVVEKSFLVKKVVFKVELLPVIKVLSSLVLFVFLLAVMMLVFCVQGYFPNIYWVQIVYYLFCLVILTFSLGWLLSSLVVFFKDIAQLTTVLLQIGFWVTPIFWSPDLLSPGLLRLVEINPMFYIVSGFRKSLITKEWFWNDMTGFAVFWLVVTLLYLVGLGLFRRLRPHFADVL